MRVGLRGRLTMAFVVPVLALVVSAAGIRSAVQVRRDAAQTVLRTANATAEAHWLLKTAVDAQTGTRGYAITGDPAFLEPYHDALREFDESAGRLEDLLGEDARQLARITELRGEFRRWWTEAARPTIDAVRSRPDGMAEARAIVSSGRGKAMLDQLRSTAGALIDAQEQRLRERRAAADRAEQAMTWYMGAAGLALLAALVIAYAAAFRMAAKAKQLSSAAGRLASGDLRARAPARSDGGDELDATARALNEMAGRLDRRGREIEGLGRLREALQACHELAEVRAVIRRLMPRLLRAPGGQVYLLSPSRDDMVREASWGEVGGPERCAADECWAVRRGQPHAYHGAEGDTLPCAHLTDPDAAALCLPLVAQDTLGLLCLAGRVDADAMRLALAAAEVLSLTAANLRLRETLRNQAIRDPLTTLFNRRFFEEAFEREAARARRKRSAVGLLLLDVDHFKRFNDTHGHPAGDALLRALARELNQGFRSSDVVCRIGGEEFGVLLPDTPLLEAARRAEVVRVAVADMRVPLGGEGIGGVTVSIGVAACPDHGEDLAALLARADAALYRSKQDGRNRITVADGSAAPAA